MAPPTSCGPSTRPTILPGDAQSPPAAIPLASEPGAHRAPTSDRGLALLVGNGSHSRRSTHEEELRLQQSPAWADSSAAPEDSGQHLPGRRSVTGSPPTCRRQLWSAHQHLEETTKGSLQTGKLADILGKAKPANGSAFKTVLRWPPLDHVIGVRIPACPAAGTEIASVKACRERARGSRIWFCGGLSARRRAFLSSIGAEHQGDDRIGGPWIHQVIGERESERLDSFGMPEKPIVRLYCLE
jgi:hypothetical protein